MSNCPRYSGDSPAWKSRSALSSGTAIDWAFRALTNAFLSILPFLYWSYFKSSSRILTPCLLQERAKVLRATSCFVSVAKSCSLSMKVPVARYPLLPRSDTLSITYNSAGVKSGTFCSSITFCTSSRLISPSLNLSRPFRISMMLL